MSKSSFPEDFNCLNKVIGEFTKGRLEDLISREVGIGDVDDILLSNPREQFKEFFNPASEIPLTSVGKENKKEFHSFVGSALIRQEDMSDIRKRYDDYYEVVFACPSGFGKTYRLLLLGCNNKEKYFSIYVNLGTDELGGKSNFWDFFSEFMKISGDATEITKKTRKKVFEFLFFRLFHLCVLYQHGVVKSPRDFMISQFSLDGAKFLNYLKIDFEEFISKEGNFDKIRNQLIKYCNIHGFVVDFMLDEINVVFSEFKEEIYLKKLNGDSPPTRPKKIQTSDRNSGLRTFAYPLIRELSSKIRVSNIFNKLYLSGTLLSFDIIRRVGSGVGKSFVQYIYYEYDFDWNETFEKFKKDLSEFLSISDVSFQEMQKYLGRFQKLDIVLGRKRIVDKIARKIRDKLVNSNPGSSDTEKGIFLGTVVLEAMDDYEKDFVENFRNEKLNSPHVKALLSLLGNIFYSKSIDIPYSLSIEGRGEYDFMTSAFAILSEKNRESVVSLDKLDVLEWKIVEPFVVKAITSEKIRGLAQINSSFVEKSEIKFLWSFVDDWKKGSKGHLLELFFLEKFCEKWGGKNLGEIFNDKISIFDGGEGFKLAKTNGDLPKNFSSLKFSVHEKPVKKHRNNREEMEYLKFGDGSSKTPNYFVSPTSNHHCDGLYGNFQNLDGKDYFFDIRVGMKASSKIVKMMELKKNIRSTSLLSSYCGIGNSETHVLKGSEDLYEKHKQWIRNLDFSIRVHVEILKINKRDRAVVNNKKDLFLMDAAAKKVHNMKNNFEEFLVFVDESNFCHFIDEKYSFVIELMTIIRDNCRMDDFRIPRSIIDALGAYTDDVMENEERRTKVVDEEESGRKMEDELSKKSFSIVHFIKGAREKSIFHFHRNEFESLNKLQKNLYEMFGKKSSPKKKKKEEDMEDEERDEEREGENPWDDYFFYDPNLDNLASIEAVWNLGNTVSSLYFFTEKDLQKQKEEEEKQKQKQKEEEEKQKQKQKEEEEKQKQKQKEEEEKQKLKDSEKVKMFLVKCGTELCFCDISPLKGKERGDTVNSLLEKGIIMNWKNNDVSGLNLFEYVSVKSVKKNVVGGELDCTDEDMFEDFGSFLVGKICFLVTNEEKSKINDLYVGTKKQGIDISKLNEFRAGSGMSFLDNWFNDDEKEDGKSGSRMKDVDEGIAEEIILECCDGFCILLKSKELIEKSLFFRKLIRFGGAEFYQVHGEGKIKIEAFSSFEMGVYLDYIGVKKDDTFVNNIENSWIKVLFRLLEFGVMFGEKELVKLILKDLEQIIFPSLLDNRCFELRFLELGYLLYDSLPIDLVNELVERWKNVFGSCENFELRKLMEYSSIVMSQNCFNEEETSFTKAINQGRKRNNDCVLWGYFERKNRKLMIKDAV